MPFKIQRRGKFFYVINTRTNRVAGKHPNSRRARKQMAAMAKAGVDLSGKNEKS